MDELAIQAIFNILVKDCGASNDSWDQFRHSMKLHDSSMSLEFRFKGGVGFGGKFHRDNRDSKWRVSCYPEDETPERLETIRRANIMLEGIRQRWLAGEIKW